MRRLALCLLVVFAACGGDRPTPPSARLTQARAGIVNGTVDVDDPAVVEILYQDTGTGSGFLCTGELVGPQTVLTAGHCTNTNKTGAPPANCPGSSNPIEYANQNNEPLCVQSDPRACPANTLQVAVLFNSGCTPSATGRSCEDQALMAGKYIIADEIQSAPTYDPCAASLSDDIGVIHLSANVMVGGQPEPALLPVNTGDLGPAGTTLPTVRFVGFGITGGGLQDSGTKRQVSKRNVQVYNSGELVEQLTSSDNGLTCSGDSGGPSLMTVAGVERIVGVTSRGDANCAQAGIDTRVDPFVGWINGYMASKNDGQLNSQVPAGTPGPVCAACTVNSDCASGVCVGSTCSDHSCSVNSDCPSGESCFPFNGSRVCYPSGGSCPASSGGTSGTTSTASSSTTSAASSTSSSTTSAGASTSGTTSSGTAGATSSTTGSAATGTSGAGATTGSAGATTSTTGGATTGSGAGGGTTAQAAPTTTAGTAGAKKGGCGSASPAELGLSLLTLAPLLRRRRRAL